MSFKNTEKQVAISFKDAKMVDSYLSIYPKIKKLIVPKVSPYGDTLNYLETESTGLQVPIYLVGSSISQNHLFWLDAETGFLFSSVSALPVYVPLFDLKSFVEIFGFNWEVYLRLGMENFDTDAGFDYNGRNFDVKELFSSYSFYDKTKSTVFNYINYRSSLVSPDQEKSLKLWRQFLPVFITISTNVFYNALNSNNILGSLIDADAYAKNRLDYLLLENSFQSPILKDLLGVLAMDTSPEQIIEKATKAKIFDTLKTEPLMFSSSNIKKYFDDVDVSTEFKESDNLFPYEIVLTQFSKLVRRFKIKGII